MPKDYAHVDKDPAIDILRTEMQRMGDLKQALFDKVSHDSGVGAGTLRNWLLGDTKRPQNLTMRFAMEAVGIHIRYVRADGTEIRKPQTWKLPYDTGNVADKAKKRK